MKTIAIKLFLKIVLNIKTIENYSCSISYQKKKIQNRKKISKQQKSTNFFQKKMLKLLLIKIIKNLSFSHFLKNNYSTNNCL